MESYYLYNDHKVHYTLKGKGNAIIFLHGFTESLEIWKEFSDRLAEDYRVFCIDLPGHGLNENIAEVHSMELMADIVHHPLKSLNIDKVVLIGHSMGGYVALAFAEKYKEMMAGLSLFHSSAFADTDETRKNRERTNEFILKNRFHFLCEFIPSLFTEENQATYKTEIEKLVNDSQKMSMQGVIAANKGMAARPDRTEVLRLADYPVLFIAGKQDSRMPLNKALEQIAIPNDSVALLMGDVAHMGFIEAKEKTFYAIKTFADSCF